MFADCLIEFKPLALRTIPLGLRGLSRFFSSASFGQGEQSRQQQFEVEGGHRAKTGIALDIPVEGGYIINGQVMLILFYFFLFFPVMCIDF